MFFWKSKGSTPLKWSVAAGIWALLLVASAALVPPFVLSAEARDSEITHSGVTIDLTVTLVGVTSFQDFQELRAGLLKSEGVEKVSLVSEAPGLVVFQVTYAGEAVSLIDKLSAFFPKKYAIKEKRLPKGGTEISISPIDLTQNQR